MAELAVLWQNLLEKCVQGREGKVICAEYSDGARKREDIAAVLEKKLLVNEDWIAAFFQQHGDAFDKHSRGRSKAESLRKEGNEFFRRKDNGAALQKYDQAIIHAPHDVPAGEDSQLALAFANRSAVFFQQKRYETCIQDVDNALTIGYPKWLLHKLLIRRGKCWHHLDKADDALQAFLEARKSIKDSGLEEEKVDAINHEVDEWIKKVANNLGRTKSDWKCQENDRLPKVSSGRNPLLVNASSTLSVLYSEEKGRHILAASEISKGDTLIVEKPYAALLLPDHYETHCHHCFKKITAFVPCKRCGDVRYCSFECSTVSWTQYHQWECHLLDLLHAIGIAHLSLRVVFVSGLDFLLAFKKDYIDTKHKAPVITGVNRDGVYQCDYCAVYELLTHIKDMDPQDVLQYAVVKGFFTNTVCNIEGLSLADKGDDFVSSCRRPLKADSAEVFIGNLLLRHMCQLVCNAHAITAVQVSDSIDAAAAVMSQSQVRIATAIYPTTSLLNHSCDPTIISSFDNDTLVVRAVKPVPKGGEIFNCYGPHYKRMPRFKRQEVLKEQYFFTCHCAPCEENEAAELSFEAFKCPRCAGPLIRKPADPAHKCAKCDFKTDALTETKAASHAQQIFEQGCSLMRTSQHHVAIKCFEKCRSIRASVMYKNHRELAEVNDSLARCYAAVGNHEKCAEHLSASTEVNKVIYGADSIEYGHELHKYSEVLCNARKLSEAFRTATKAEEIFRAHYGDHHELVLEIKEYLSQLQMLNSF